MHRSSKIYKDTANIVANPREVEANLLYQSASRLQAIQDHWEEKASELKDALLYNRRLWTIFLTSVTHAENPLPKEIRENVANLGLFVLRRTLLAAGRTAARSPQHSDRDQPKSGFRSVEFEPLISLRGQSVRDPRERHAMAPKRAFA